MPKIIILSLLMYASGLAQFSLTTKMMSAYDDNVNNNMQRLASSITSMNMNAGYEFLQSERSLDVYYEGTYNYYAELPEHTNFLQTANILYSNVYGEEAQNEFLIGANAEYGAGRGSYTVFDHNSISAFGKVKFFLNERFLNQYGYTFRSISMPQLRSLSFSENAMYAHAAFALSPKTTIIFQTDLGLKTYSTPLTTEIKSHNSFVPDIAQISGLFKIGQNITESTGLSLMTKYQWNLLKKSRYLSSDYGLISDDELFDDHYGYEGSLATLTLTKMISETAVAKITAGYQTKIYSTLPAYDLQGIVIANERTDNRSFISLQLDKEFPDYGFTIRAGTDIINNRSNDLFYRYSNFATSLTILYSVF